MITEAYLELIETSIMKPLTIFAKELHPRCLTEL